MHALIFTCFTYWIRSWTQEWRYGCKCKHLVGCLWNFLTMFSLIIHCFLKLHYTFSQLHFLNLFSYKVKFWNLIDIFAIILSYSLHSHMVPGTAYSRSGGMDRFAEACVERPREMSSMNFDFVHIVSMSDFLNCRSSCSFNWHVILFHHAYHTC